MRNILSGSRGMATLVLVLLIAWALLSVIFLTGTLLAARSIDRSVNTAKTGINPLVGDIGKDAKFIDQARTIADTSGKILTAAKPLSGQLTVIERTARTGIDPKLKSILGQVGDINEVAGSINTNVLQIGSSVGSILGSAQSIGGSVGSINARVRTILRRARSINGSARSILSRGGFILSRVQSIDVKVARANSQADSVDADTKVIAPNVAKILATVGKQGTPGHVLPGTIHGHVNSIDCSLLINGVIGGGILTPITDLLAGVGLLPPAAPGTSDECNR